jgi:hypothetical protein
MDSDKKIVLAPNSNNLFNFLYLIIGILILITTIYLPLILPLKIGLIIFSAVIILGYLYLIISFKPQVLITSQKIIFKLRKNESFEIPLSEINKIGFQKFVKGKKTLKLLGLKFENFSSYEEQFKNSDRNTKNFIILGKNIKNATGGLADIYLNIYFNLGQSFKKLETNLKNLKINLEDFDQINY